MIEVLLDGYKYRYCKSESGGYWLGLEGYKGSLGRYSNCKAPTMLWPSLREKAYSSGYTVEDFAPIVPKETKVKRASSKKKSDTKNSISIF